ncbi:MAG: M20/M25/M40 family metallo-hydrolase [Alphaproteobacteria bacterium]|nr:M20/M25/M40 family metallo-hydrolase [Alphaproteobacteria bacterium]
MDLINTVSDLIRFRTETGNTKEINQCLEYCKNLFAGTSAKIDVFRKDNIAPVLFIRNHDVEDFDVVILGHLDVVPAEDHMFEPKIEGLRMIGRGTLDMKSFAAVAFNSMFYVLENNLDLKFGIILSTDEEKGSAGTHAFMDAHPDISAKIVLDNDVGGDILKIVNKCKNPVFVKLISEGKEAHGSTPWDGIDANEKLMQTWVNIRKIYPYFSKEQPMPDNTWIDTVHFAKISGGDVANVISNYAEALLDFRLTEDSSVENLEKNLQKCMVDGVTYKIVSSSTPVVMDPNNPYIQDYKKFAEHILGREIEFEQIGGATDSRSFAVKGSTVIMHSGTGDGMHAKNEYVEIDSVKKIADIQIKFLEKLAKK